MAGLASPDLPAFVCYAIVASFGLIVAWSTINELLATHPDHWAFAGTWALFFAHAALPILLFWFLDYTSALHDTSLFAALLVSFGYQQIFAGAVQGVTMPGQTPALWKPFQAWVTRVADRIATKQKLYRDRFDEKVRSLIASDPQLMTRFETLVRSSSRDIAALQTAVRGIASTGDAEADARRKLDILWRDIRQSQPENYGWLLRKRGIVRLWRYWMWLSNGLSKLISGSIILAGVLLALVVYLWSSSGVEGLPSRELALVRYHHWRFLKPNGTDRDHWRSVEFLSERLRQTNATSIITSKPQPASEPTVVAGSSVETLLGPLLKELHFPSVSDRQARAILSLIMNAHAPVNGPYVVPELIESLRTAGDSVRLQIRNALVAIQKADYPGATLPDALAKWEPKKDESSGDIDERVRTWRRWWQTAERSAAPRQPSPPSMR